MGACTSRQEGPDFTTPSGDNLLMPASVPKSTNLSCVSATKDGDEGPFAYRINFGSRQLDAEAQVIKCLADLLWHSTEDKAPQMSECIAVLRRMQAAGSEALGDLAVPVINVVLHAPCQAVREKLWNEFVVDAVNTDFTLAHLFYWALHSVVKSPEAEGKTQQLAQKRLDEVSRAMSAKAQLSAALAAIGAANSAARQGASKLPGGARKDAASVTPLVDLLERLHVIGEVIVPVKDKEARLLFLRERLRQDINEAALDPTSVPVLMLAPQAWPRQGPNSQSGAVLRIPPEECRVLSSKERAPYLVVLEVDRGVAPGVNAGSTGGQTRRGWGLCPCRSRRIRPVLEENATLLTGKETSSKPSTASPVRDDSGPENGSGGRAHGVIQCLRHETVEMDITENEVSKYLLQQDCRPKGAFQEATWDQVVERTRRDSIFGDRPLWGMLSMIVKSHADDVRQEELAYRLLKWFKRVFKRHRLKHWLHPFLIIATHHDGGCLETVTNAVSLSDLKKSYGKKWHSLRAYFEQTYPRSKGENGQITFDKAVLNFIWSMAAYSIVCYVLAIRDRHNGNILIDDEGHILHVDFGFMLCGAPGGKALQKMGGFEHSEGFKLTQELAEVLGPMDDKPFNVFRTAVREGMLAVRHHAEELLALLQLSMLGTENSLQRCFTHPKGYPEAVLEDVCEKLGLQTNGKGSMSDDEFGQLVDRRTDESVDHWRSRLYDKYQYHFTGVH